MSGVAPQDQLQKALVSAHASDEARDVQHVEIELGLRDGREESPIPHRAFAPALQHNLDDFGLR
jgi:hypothetical protein